MRFKNVPPFQPGDWVMYGHSTEPDLILRCYAFQDRSGRVRWACDYLMRGEMNMRIANTPCSLFTKADNNENSNSVQVAGVGQAGQ